MQVSVIIVNYKVRYFLELCVSSVRAALRGIQGEIIVVDNHSGDGSCEMLAEKFPDVIRIENKQNTGFSKANNQGVSIAKGKYILILNPDTVIAEDSIAKLIHFYEENERPGICGVKLIDGTGNFLPESKRSVPTPWISVQKMFGISNAKKGKYYATHIGENEVGKAAVLVGAFMFVSREKYLEAGGFDEAYFMYGEDIDLSYKMLQKGYDNYYFPQTQIIHYKGESTAKNLRYLDNFYGAMRIFYKKHFPPNRLYDLSVYLGIKLWYFLKFIQIKKQNTPKTSPKNILYAGSENKVFEALQKYYQPAKVHLFAVCETRVISAYDDLEKIRKIIRENHIDCLVFDGKSNSYKKIIFYMSSLSKQKLLFKIRPENTNFILGSNRADSKGEVFMLDITPEASFNHKS